MREVRRLRPTSSQGERDGTVTGTQTRPAQQIPVLSNSHSAQTPSLAPARRSHGFGGNESPRKQNATKSFACVCFLRLQKRATLRRAPRLIKARQTASDQREVGNLQRLSVTRENVLSGKRRVCFLFPSPRCVQSQMRERERGCGEEGRHS